MIKNPASMPSTKVPGKVPVSSVGSTGPSTKSVSSSGAKVQQASPIMAFLSGGSTEAAPFTAEAGYFAGPTGGPGFQSGEGVPMLGSNVAVAQPQPNKPLSIGEAEMMKALMRRMEI